MLNRFVQSISLTISEDVSTSPLANSQRDLITHNRIARLAADLTTAAFACLLTYDRESGEISVAAISGTNTALFSQVNASARRSQADWVPLVTVEADVNTALVTIFQRKASFSATVREFLDGVIATPLARSTFARFYDHWCVGKPIVIEDVAYAAIIFVASGRFTKPQEDLIDAFVDQCRNSVSSLTIERDLTDQIDQLTEQRRLVQLNDPLGLTQRRDASSRTPRSFGDVRLSLETQTAARGGRELKLTRREFDLLDIFLQSPGTALSRGQIISRVWNERTGISSNVLNVTIKKPA